MATIDETLAKGLATRFLREVDTLKQRFINSSATQEFLANDNLSDSKKNWLKQARIFHKFVRSFSFASYEIGSKSKPAVAYLMPSPANDSTKQYDEDVIYANYLMCRFPDAAPSQVSPSISGVKFSKHALARLIQRAPCATKLLENWSFEFVLSLMRPGMIYSGFWLSLFINRIFSVKQHLHLDDDLLFFAPSPYGLFLCELKLYSNVPFIEVKTFVDIAHLRTEQEDLRKFSLEVFSSFDDYPIGLAPWEFFGCNFIFLHLLVWARLASKRESIENFICEKLDSHKREIFAQLEIMDPVGGDETIKFGRQLGGVDDPEVLRLLISKFVVGRRWPKIWS